MSYHSMWHRSVHKVQTRHLHFTILSATGGSVCLQSTSECLCTHLASPVLLLWLLQRPRELQKRSGNRSSYVGKELIWIQGDWLLVAVLEQKCWIKSLPEVPSDLRHPVKLQPVLWKLLFYKFSSRFCWEDPYFCAPQRESSLFHVTSIATRVWRVPEPQPLGNRHCHPFLHSKGQNVHTK